MIWTLLKILKNKKVKEIKSKFQIRKENLMRILNNRLLLGIVNKKIFP